MAPPDTEALQDTPEDVMRRVAREEARAVYDELTATDADGESWSLQRLMDNFGLNRRQAIKALGLIAIGFTAPQAVARLFVGTARADAAGQIGTEADPVTKVWAHELESGDGATEIQVTDSLFPDADNTRDLGAAGTQWSTVFTDTVEASSVVTDELNNVIYQRSSETVQAAIDRASSGDKVILRPGTFSENVSITTADITVVGAGRGTLISGGPSNAILIDGVTGVTIRDLAVETPAGGGDNGQGIRIVGHGSSTDTGHAVENVWVEQSDTIGIIVGANEDKTRIVGVWLDSANVDGNDVQVDADNCVADDIIGTVTDNGTGNAIGETA